MEGKGAEEHHEINHYGEVIINFFKKYIRIINNIDFDLPLRI